MLEECINSILSIGLPMEEREIILVDDGSDISPMQSINAGSNGIDYIRQENKGLSEARNAALRRAKGRYIQFVDSDDYLIVGEYQKLLDTVLAEDLDILLFRFTHTIGSAEETCNKGEMSIIDGVRYLCRNNLRGAACLYVFKKDILCGLEFMSGIWHEDMLFTPLLLLNAKRVADLTTVAYFYRLHEGTIMSNTNELHLQKRFNDSITVLKCLKAEMDNSTGTRCKALKRVIDQQVMNLVYNIITIKKLLGCRLELRSRIAQLRSNDIYPVSLSLYSWKYLIFAILSRVGIFG